jgi:hypothetical protein
VVPERAYKADTGNSSCLTRGSGLCAQAPSKRVAAEALEALTLLLCAAAPPSVADGELPEQIASRLAGRVLHVTAADGKSAAVSLSALIAFLRSLLNPD